MCTLWCFLSGVQLYFNARRTAPSEVVITVNHGSWVRAGPSLPPLVCDPTHRRVGGTSADARTLVLTHLSASSQSESPPVPVNERQGKKWPESKRRCPPTASSIMTRRGDERSLYHLHFAANAPLSFFLSLSLPFLLFFLSFRCCLQSVRRRTYALLLGPLCSYR